MTPVLSLSNNVPLFLSAMIVKILVVFVVLILIVAYATWLERKVIGHMQTRLGLCGPAGTACCSRSQTG